MPLFEFNADRRLAVERGGRRSEQNGRTIRKSRSDDDSQSVRQSIRTSHTTRLHFVRTSTRVRTVGSDDGGELFEWSNDLVALVRSVIVEDKEFVGKARRNNSEVGRQWTARGVRTTRRRHRRLRKRGAAMGDARTTPREHASWVPPPRKQGWLSRKIVSPGAVGETLVARVRRT